MNENNIMNAPENPADEFMKLARGQHGQHDCVCQAGRLAIGVTVMYKQLTRGRGNPHISGFLRKSPTLAPLSFGDAGEPYDRIHENLRTFSYP